LRVSRSIVGCATTSASISCIVALVRANERDAKVLANLLTVRVLSAPAVFDAESRLKRVLGAQEVGWGRLRGGGYGWGLGDHKLPLSERKRRTRRFTLKNLLRLGDRRVDNRGHLRASERERHRLRLASNSRVSENGARNGRRAGERGGDPHRYKPSSTPKTSARTTGKDRRER
jgi:hypothetical protein